MSPFTHKWALNYAIDFARFLNKIISDIFKLMISNDGPVFTVNPCAHWSNMFTTIYLNPKPKTDTTLVVTLAHCNVRGWNIVSFIVLRV